MMIYWAKYVKILVPPPSGTDIEFWILYNGGVEALYVADMKSVMNDNHHIPLPTCKGKSCAYTLHIFQHC